MIWRLVYVVMSLVLGLVTRLEAQKNNLIPKKPEPARFVHDGAKWFKPQGLEMLELKLKNYEKERGHQIVVATIKTLQGQKIETLANEWFNAWGIGQKGLDNGVLILVSSLDRLSRIEVGRGLEAKLSDVQAGRLLKMVLKPQLQSKQYEQGFVNLLDSLFFLLDSEEELNALVAEEVKAEGSKQERGNTILWRLRYGAMGIGFLILILAFIYKEPESSFALFAIFSCVELLVVFCANSFMGRYGFGMGFWIKEGFIYVLGNYLVITFVGFFLPKGEERPKAKESRTYGGRGSGSGLRGSGYYDSGSYSDSSSGSYSDDSSFGGGGSDGGGASDSW